MEDSRLKARLTQSIEKGYYFEALFILSSLIESFCKNTCKELNKTDRISFEEAINVIAENNIISADFANQLHQWRNIRNKIVHELMDNSINESELVASVTEGSHILNFLDGIVV